MGSVTRTSHTSWAAGASARAIDLTLGALLLMLCAPVIVAAALVAGASLRTRPWFVQTRTGMAGRRFRLLKVRTLPTSVPEELDKYALASHPIPRATQVLRDLHLDELPQLLNVVTGSMSLVGPRPEMESLQPRLSRRHGQLRAAVKPGMTGLWQLSPHVVGLIHEHPEYDAFYVEHWTVRLDLWILWRTVRRALRGRPTTLDDVPRWTIRPSPSAAAPVASGAQAD